MMEDESARITPRVPVEASSVRIWRSGCPKLAAPSYAPFLAHPRTALIIRRYPVTRQGATRTKSRTSRGQPGCESAATTEPERWAGLPPTLRWYENR